MEIIPAILPKNFREIEEKIERLDKAVKLVQIDICDGKFVPTTTWPYWKEDENFAAILKEERGMPGWETTNFEFDLMIQNPSLDEIKKWVIAGASRIILHYESSKNLREIIDYLQGLVEIGISIGSTTNISVIDEYKDKIQYIQIMGIRKAGFQGQKFEENTVRKVTEAKKQYPNLKIQVDGGISWDTIEELKEAGLDRAVIGSAIFESDDVVESIAEFKRV